MLSKIIVLHSNLKRKQYILISFNNTKKARAPNKNICGIFSYTLKEANVSNKNCPSSSKR